MIERELDAMVGDVEGSQKKIHTQSQEIEGVKVVLRCMDAVNGNGDDEILDVSKSMDAGSAASDRQKELIKMEIFQKKMEINRLKAQIEAIASKSELNHNQNETEQEQSVQFEEKLGHLEEVLDRINPDLLERKIVHLERMFQKVIHDQGSHKKQTREAESTVIFTHQVAEHSQEQHSIVENSSNSIIKEGEAHPRGETNHEGSEKDLSAKENSSSSKKSSSSATDAEKTKIESLSNCVGTLQKSKGSKEQKQAQVLANLEKVLDFRYKKDDDLVCSGFDDRADDDEVLWELFLQLNPDDEGYVKIENLMNASKVMDEKKFLLLRRAMDSSILRDEVRMAVQNVYTATQRLRGVETATNSSEDSSTVNRSAALCSESASSGEVTIDSTFTNLVHCKRSQQNVQGELVAKVDNSPKSREELLKKAKSARSNMSFFLDEMHDPSTTLKESLKSLDDLIEYVFHSKDEMDKMKSSPIAPSLSAPTSQVQGSGVQHSDIPVLAQPSQTQDSFGSISGALPPNNSAKVTATKSESATSKASTVQQIIEEAMAECDRLVKALEDLEEVPGQIDFLALKNALRKVPRVSSQRITWVRSMGLDSALARHLKPGNLENGLLGVQKMKTEERENAIIAFQHDAKLLFDRALQKLDEQKVSSSALEANSKFSGFTGSFATLEEFYAGAEETMRLGYPNPDIEKGILVEHTDTEHPSVERIFVTSNYLIATCLLVEYFWAVDPWFETESPDPSVRKARDTAKSLIKAFRRDRGLLDAEDLVEKRNEHELGAMDIESLVIFSIPVAMAQKLNATAVIAQMKTKRIQIFESEEGSISGIRIIDQQACLEWKLKSAGVLKIVSSDDDCWKQNISTGNKESDLVMLGVVLQMSKEQAEQQCNNLKTIVQSAAAGQGTQSRVSIVKNEYALFSVRHVLQLLYSDMAMQSKEEIATNQDSKQTFLLQCAQYALQYAQTSDLRKILVEFKRDTENHTGNENLRIDMIEKIEKLLKQEALRDQILLRFENWLGIAENIDRNFIDFFSQNGDYSFLLLQMDDSSSSELETIIPSHEPIINSPEAQLQQSHSTSVAPGNAATNTTGADIRQGLQSNTSPTTNPAGKTITKIFGMNKSTPVTNTAASATAQLRASGTRSPMDPVSSNPGDEAVSESVLKQFTVEDFVQSVKLVFDGIDVLGFDHRACLEWRVRSTSVASALSRDFKSACSVEEGNLPKNTKLLGVMLRMNSDAAERKCDILTKQVYEDLEKRKSPASKIAITVTVDGDSVFFKTAEYLLHKDLSSVREQLDKSSAKEMWDFAVRYGFAKADCRDSSATTKDTLSLILKLFVKCQLQKYIEAELFYARNLSKENSHSKLASEVSLAGQQLETSAAGVNSVKESKKIHRDPFFYRYLHVQSEKGAFLQKFENPHLYEKIQSRVGLSHANLIFPGEVGDSFEETLLLVLITKQIFVANDDRKLLFEKVSAVFSDLGTEKEEQILKTKEGKARGIRTLSSKAFLEYRFCSNGPGKDSKHEYSDFVEQSKKKLESLGSNGLLIGLLLPMSRNRVSSISKELQGIVARASETDLKDVVFVVDFYNDKWTGELSESDCENLFFKTMRYCKHIGLKDLRKKLEELSFEQLQFSAIEDWGIRSTKGLEEKDIITTILDSFVMQELSRDFELALKSTTVLELRAVLRTLSQDWEVAYTGVSEEMISTAVDALKSDPIVRWTQVSKWVELYCRRIQGRTKVGLDSIMRSKKQTIQTYRLQRGEVLATYLYTGPGFAPYNSVYRKFPLNIYNLLGGDGRSGKNMKRNTLSTTLFCISSALVKLGRYTELPENRKVYRGLGSMLLPSQFWVEHGTPAWKGGVEKAIMSTTSDKDVAVEYANGKGMVVEIGIGRIQIGGDVGWISMVVANFKLSK